MEDTTEINIKKTFCGDMKFIEIMYGLLSANSNYPCPWCHCHKNEFGNLSKEWPIANSDSDARTLEKAKQNILKKKPDFGYNKKPIINIDFKNCVIDMLHVLLRIFDVLKKLFLYDLFHADGLGEDLTKKPNVSLFLNFLENECKICNCYYIVEKRIELRSFSGNEIINILEKCSHLEKLFKIPKISDICSLWYEFYSLYKCLQKNEEIDIILLKQDLLQWLSLFKNIYGAKNITPYMHAFVFHMPEFINLHGNINRYNLQGLEKLNDITTQIYHRSSNKKETFLKQILEKRNRQEFYLINSI